MKEKDKKSIIKRAKSLIAGALAATSIIIPSAVRAEKPIDKTSSPKVGPVTVDKDVENQYEEALDYATFETEKGIEETTAIEEAILSEETTAIEESTPPEEIIINNEDIIREEEVKVFDRLKALLEEKGFSEEANKLVIDSYNLIDSNYGKTYHYKEAPKLEYLNDFVDAVSNLNGINLVPAFSEEANTFELSMLTPAKHDSINNTINMLSDMFQDEITKIFIHEMRHEMDIKTRSVLYAAHSKAFEAIVEGSAAGGEDNAQSNIQVEGYSIFNDDNFEVSVKGEFAVGEDSVREYMSYQMYESVTDEHFSCLLGEDAYNKAKKADGDILFNIYNAFVTQYGKEQGESLLKSYFKLARFMDGSGLYESGHETDRIANLNYEIGMFQPFLEVNDKEDYNKKIDDQLETYDWEVIQYQEIIDAISNESSISEYEKDTYTQIYKSYISARTLDRETFEKFRGVDYKNFQQFVKFVIENDNEEIDMLTKKLDGKYSPSDAVIAFETECQKMIDMQIATITTKEEADSIRAMLAYYYQAVLIDVKEKSTDKNLTEESFLALPKRLMEKERELGIERENKAEEQSEKNDSQFASNRYFEDYFEFEM